jgi:hypothetical protein
MKDVNQFETAKSTIAKNAKQPLRAESPTGASLETKSYPITGMIDPNNTDKTAYNTAAKLSLVAMSIEKQTGFNRAKTPDCRRDSVRKGIDIINAGQYSQQEKAALLEIILALGASSMNELRKEASLKFHGSSEEPLKTHLAKLAEYVMPNKELQIKNAAIALTEAIEEIGKEVGDLSWKQELERQMIAHYESHS